MHWLCLELSCGVDYQSGTDSSHFQYYTSQSGLSSELSYGISSIPNSSATPNPHAVAQRRAWLESQARHELTMRMNSQPYLSAHSSPGQESSLGRNNNEDLLSGPSYPSHSYRTSTTRTPDNLRLDPAVSQQRRADGTSHQPIQVSSSPSSEEEDAYSRAEGRYRPSPEFLYQSNHDELRATMRAAIASKTKIPTKEALHSLISMTIEEVKAEKLDTS